MDRSASLRVAVPPNRPVMIFDGDCGFCRFWIERWRLWTRGQIEFVPYQETAVASRFPEVPSANCEQAVQLVSTDGGVARGAEAVFLSLAGVWWATGLIRLYRVVSPFRRSSERAYTFVAEHRQLFSRLTRWLWGVSPEPPGYATTATILGRGVALIFLAAFVSLWVQVHGLVGERGILPAGEFIHAAGSYFDQGGLVIGRYFSLPTFGWIATGDVALHVYCALGTLCALLALAGIFPAAALAVCWLLYLTLVGLGQDFLSFQWDTLLLEAGLLAALMSPWTKRWRAIIAVNPCWGILLARWLVFRLMFESGAVKLVSGDPVWRNLTALRFHFETQPLPHWLGWYAHQLPGWVLKPATLLMFVVELLVPFLIFAPRRLRLLAAAALAGLQLTIIATGNYGIFNWLSLVLCVAVLDDRAIALSRDWLRRKLSRRVVTPGIEESGNHAVTSPSVASRLQRVVLATYAAVVVVIGLAQLDNLFGSRSDGRGPVSWVRRQLDPFHVVNRYGLFAFMSTARPELIVEGSLDGAEWRPYVFKYKPGALNRRPPIVPFHLPRLDWQMWFAALQEREPPRWFGRFAQRLFEHSPVVLGLLANDPFPDKPPRYLRVLAYDFRFSAPSMKRNTGQWWAAFNRRHYVPVMQWEPPNPVAKPPAR